MSPSGVGPWARRREPPAPHAGVHGPGSPATCRRRCLGPSTGPELTRLSSGGHRQRSRNSPRWLPMPTRARPPPASLAATVGDTGHLGPSSPVGPGGQGARPGEGSETRGRRTEAGANSGFGPQPWCRSHPATLDTSWHQHLTLISGALESMTQPAPPDRHQSHSLSDRHRNEAVCVGALRKGQQERHQEDQ